VDAFEARGVALDFLDYPDKVFFPETGDVFYAEDAGPVPDFF